MKVTVDINEFKSLLDEEFKWDRAHKEECGWDDRDIVMIAEGMLEATNTLIKMYYAKEAAAEI